MHFALFFKIHILQKDLNAIKEIKPIIDKFYFISNFCVLLPKRSQT